MRVYFAEVKTRYQAIKECPFTPSNIVKVCGGFMCFESTSDYRIFFFKNLKTLLFNIATNYWFYCFA